MKMRSQEIISALVYLCVSSSFIYTRGDDDLLTMLATHTDMYMYIYIETHTHDHTFSLSAHTRAHTRLARRGLSGFSDPGDMDISPTPEPDATATPRGARSLEMARSAGKNKKRERRAETPCD